jgi:hypothetical protein
MCLSGLAFEASFVITASYDVASNMCQAIRAGKTRWANWTGARERAGGMEAWRYLSTILIENSLTLSH